MCCNVCQCIASVTLYCRDYVIKAEIIFDQSFFCRRFNLNQAVRIHSLNPSKIIVLHTLSLRQVQSRYKCIHDFGLQRSSTQTTTETTDTRPVRLSVHCTGQQLPEQFETIRVINLADNITFSKEDKSFFMIMPNWHYDLPT